MKRNKQLFTPSVKRIIYGSTFLLGVSMSNVIDIPGISPEIVYGGTLIPNVTATASSYVDPYGPERAVDSDVTHEYSRWYAKGSNNYLVLDLKQNYKIDRWVVQNIGTLGWSLDNNASDYNLSGSLDGKSWAPIDTVIGNTLNSTDKTISNPSLARYVKLEVKKGNQNNNNWTSIAEFNVYAAPASISSVSVPANGTYKTGQTLNFTVNFDGNVNLFGTASSLSLNVGGQIKQATYTSQAGNSITYSYTVQSGDLDKDGIAIDALNLNGDIITDSLNNGVSNTLINVGNTSEILVQSGYKINIPSLIGGTISTIPAGEEIEPGTSISVDVMLNLGVRIKEGTLKYNDGSDHLILGNTFVMPNKDVTISAELERVLLPVSADLTDGTTVKSGKSVILGAENGTTIYYTVGTDLLEPADPTTASSFILSGESISITGEPGETVKVKAYAMKAGAVDSPITTFTYKIQGKQSLEVKGLSADNKTYDGTTSVSIQGTAALDAVGILSGFENVSLSGSPIGEFGNKNAGNGKAVTVNGYTLTGVDADYYELIYPALTADITPKYTTVSGITAKNKNYDGTKTAQLDISSADFSGLLSGDSVSIDLSTATIEFEDASEGSNKSVNVSGIKLAGDDKDNYQLTNIALTLTANITGAATNPEVKSVEITPASSSVVQGGSKKLTAVVDAVGGANDAVSWTSDDAAAKVTVDGTGNVVVAGDAATGDYIITAKSIFDTSKKGTSTITVTSAGSAVTPAINSVEVTPASGSVAQGGSKKLTAVVDAVGGADDGVSWTSNDASNKVTVDGTGKVLVAADAATGDYTITAKSTFDTSKKGISTITVTSSGTPVTQAVNSVQVTPGSGSVAQGGSRQLTAVVDAVGGADDGVSWTSSDVTNKVTVDGTGKVLVAADAAIGAYTITAESIFDGTKKGTSTITVTAASIPVTPPVNPPVQPTPEEPTNNDKAIKIVKQPSKQTVRRGNTASFSIKVEGTETFIYQWQKDGDALSEDNNISGANKSKLKIEDVRKSDEGEYRCIVADGIGNVTTSSAVTLKVTSRTTNNNNDSNSTTNTSDISNNSSSQNSNNSDTTTININSEEAASTTNLDKIMNAIKSEKINTIIVDVNQTKAGDGVPQNKTNIAGGANPPLLSEEVLTILKTNTNKTLIIKNGDSSIQVKSNSQGQIQFTQNNTPVTGFVTIGNSEYYSNENGIMQTDWLQTGENIYYYLNPVTGVKEKGWIKDVNGTWYYLDTTSGIMKTGWLNDNGALYYLKSNGAMATGWLQDVDGKWYYFYQNGAMAKNATINGYYVDENGVWIM